MRKQWGTSAGLPATERDAIYREAANGRVEYWTNSDAQRVYVSRSWAEEQVNRGYARYVDVK